MRVLPHVCFSRGLREEWMIIGQSMPVQRPARKDINRLSLLDARWGETNIGIRTGVNRRFEDESATGRQNVKPESMFAGVLEDSICTI